MRTFGDGRSTLKMVFFGTARGREPVRDWLRSLSQDDRRDVGRHIKVIQDSWPVGMPLVRKLEPGLWEVRLHLRDGIGRVLFTVIGDEMILLHGFVKSRRGRRQRIWVPQDNDLPSGTRGGAVENIHRGSDFDDWLREEGLLEDAQAYAAKRVVAFQIEREMKRLHITKSEMAKRMGTSRPAVDRLLDPWNQSLTLSTLERAASAVGMRLKIELSA
jgi:phage-related protein